MPAFIGSNRVLSSKLKVGTENSPLFVGASSVHPSTASSFSSSVIESFLTQTNSASIGNGASSGTSTNQNVVISAQIDNSGANSGVIFARNGTRSALILRTQSGAFAARCGTNGQPPVSGCQTIEIPAGASKPESGVLITEFNTTADSVRMWFNDELLIGTQTSIADASGFWAGGTENYYYLRPLPSGPGVTWSAYNAFFTDYSGPYGVIRLYGNQTVSPDVFFNTIAAVPNATLSPLTEYDTPVEFRSSSLVAAIDVEINSASRGVILELGGTSVGVLVGVANSGNLVVRVGPQDTTLAADTSALVVPPNRIPYGNKKLIIEISATSPKTVRAWFGDSRLFGQEHFTRTTSTITGTNFGSTFSVDASGFYANTLGDPVASTWNTVGTAGSTRIYHNYLVPV